MLLYVSENNPLADKKWVDYDDLYGTRLIETQDAAASRSCQIIKDLLTQNHSEVDYIVTLDMGSQQYLLETTDYSIIASAMTSRFWTPPKRQALPFRDPSAAINYHLLYLSKKAGKCKPFVKWLREWCLSVSQTSAFVCC